jgi:parallel beta-helix repeat protein
MEKKTVSAITLTLLLTGMLTLAFNIQPVKASGTIYIRADGSIDPPTAPISTTDNVTYTLTGNITIYVINTDGIDIRRDNIVVDGAGYSVQGAGSGKGIALSGRSNVTIKNMVITAFGYGIWLSYSSNNSIAGNNITNNWCGIVLEYSSNNSISGNNITANDDVGIFLYFSPNNTICKNNVTKSYEYGIRLSSSSGNFIFGNNITANGEHGVRLYNSSNNKIFGNNIAENNGGGIDLYISNGNNITGNTVIHNLKGIFLEYSGYNSISGNVITNNHYGVILKISTGNVLRSNNMTDNSYNMGIYGIDDDLFHFGSVSLSSFLQDIDSSNTVNGKPVYYWVNQHGNRIPDDAGFVAAINCTKITVSNIKPTKNVQGILFAFTTNSVLQNLTATDNEVGVHLVGSDNNTITANNVTKNDFGISLYYSSRNNFIQNIVTENDQFGVGIGIGLALYSASMFPWTTIPSEGNLFRDNLISNNNYWRGLTLSNPGTRYTIITDNNITNNRNGIYLRESSNNSIYHNNFVDNNPQVYIETSGYANFWDDGYPSGGNYWSDYVDVDLYSGPYQNESGKDGIGDFPRVIDSYNQDNYPLVKPWPLVGDVNEDGKVDVSDLTIMVNAIPSVSGMSNWNPNTDINNDGLCDIADLVKCIAHIPSSW